MWQPLPPLLFPCKTYRGVGVLCSPSFMIGGGGVFRFDVCTGQTIWHVSCGREQRRPTVWGLCVLEFCVSGVTWYPHRPSPTPVCALSMWFLMDLYLVVGVVQRLHRRQWGLFWAHAILGWGAGCPAHSISGSQR